MKIGRLRIICTIAFAIYLITGRAQICFNPITSYSCVPSTTTTLNNGIKSMIINDFNADGYKDIVVANSNTNLNFIQVFLGSATGTFTGSVNTSLGNSFPPNIMASADFNGDNKPDLAIVQYYTGSISILLGTGTGSFILNTSMPVNGVVYKITSADFNQDGKQDLVIPQASMNNDSVAVYFGLGNGSFTPVQKFKVGYVQNRVLVADFNNDTKPDIIGVNNGSGITLLLGTGTGSFGSVSSFFVGSLINVQDIISADFNNDGNQDIATTDYSTSINIILGTGTGIFLTPSSFFAGSQPYSLLSADFDGNGKTDLAVGKTGSQDLTVLLNKTPYFSAYTATNTICYGSSAVITVTGEATNSYSWSTSQTGTSIVVSPTISTNYFVTALANGCTNTKNISITVDVCNNVGIKGTHFYDDLPIFPNPVFNTLNIPNTNALWTNITVLDVTGKVITQQNLKSGLHSLDLTELNKGIYLLEFKSNDGLNKRIKIIKE